MNGILSFFKITPQALTKWVALAIGGLAGKYITTLSPDLQGAASTAIVGVSSALGAVLAHFLHISEAPAKDDKATN